MKRFFLTILLVLLCNNSYGEIYKWVDAQGKAHFSDQIPETARAEKIDVKVNTYTHVTYDTSLYDVGRKVVMYSTDWCGYCKKARSYFRKNHIRFTDYDIEKDANASKRYKKLGASGVPVILVGKRRMNGFSEKGFERIYRR